MPTAATTNAAKLTIWYTRPETVDEFEREDIYCDVHNFRAYAVRNGVVAIKSPLGRALLTKKTIKGGDIIVFEYVADAPGSRLKTFWFNAASLESLSDSLRAARDWRVPFDDIFFGTL